MGTESPHVRVVSLNVRTAIAFDGRHSWPFRRRALVDALNAIAADVICLQEVLACPRRYILGRLAGEWAACGRPRGRRGVGERCLVLVRSDVLDVTGSHTRWFGDHPDQPGSTLPGARHPRIATLVTLRSKDDGREFGVANVHLDVSAEERRSLSTRQLVGWLDQAVPWVVAGDFNAAHDSAVLEPLEEVGYRDTLPDPGAAGEPAGTFHGFTGRSDGPRIDYVLVSPGWRVAKAAVWTEAPAGRMFSDHWPVVADLELDERRQALSI